MDGGSQEWMTPQMGVNKTVKELSAKDGQDQQLFL
jgi:hypothetical protein